MWECIGCMNSSLRRSARCCVGVKTFEVLFAESMLARVADYEQWHAAAAQFFVSRSRGVGCIDIEFTVGNAVFLQIGACLLAVTAALCAVHQQGLGARRAGFDGRQVVVRGGEAIDRCGVDERGGLRGLLVAEMQFAAGVAPLVDIGGGGKAGRQQRQ